MQPSALASTSEALQHSQSTLNYLARAVRHGQEIDQSFPTPSEGFQTPPWEHSDPKPRPVVQATACTDDVIAHQKHLEDETCLSVSAEYSLALINENFKQFVQSVNLQCLELPSSLTKRQKQKVSNIWLLAQHLMCVPLVKVYL